MEVPAALGLDPSIANSVHRAINDGVGAVLPSGLQRTILDGIFAVGRAQVSEFFLNEKNPLGFLRLAKRRQIFDEGKSLQLQFPAQDLGFRYLEGALVPACNSVAGTPEAPTGRRRDYTPIADPGYRLPHMNVRVFSNSSSKIISTLDLISGNKVEFLLIIAPIESSYHLARAALEAAEEFKVSIRVCVLWSDENSKGIEVGSEASLAPWENYKVVREARKSPTSPSWWDICKMASKGAILVRPDEHIAWREKSGLVADPKKEMKRVFSAVLGFK